MATNDPAHNFLQNQINSQSRVISDLENRLKDQESTLEAFATKSDVQREINVINAVMNDYNKALATLENKLIKVLLPDQTRFFLEQSEITDFRNNFRQLRALSSDLERSRQAFIKLSARFNLTNSRI